MKFHQLKIWPQFFDDVADERKLFEFRKDDRGFEVGDELLLEEFRPHVGEYTGRAIRAEITYILRHGKPHTKAIEHIGLPKGYCILGIVVRVAERRTFKQQEEEPVPA